MHEQILHTDLNNSEIRYKKAIFLTWGASHLRTLYVYATGRPRSFGWPKILY